MKSSAQFRLVVVLAIAPLFLASGCSKAAKRDRLLAEAAAHYAAGDYNSAEVEYLNVLKAEAFNPMAVARLGEIYAEQGKVGSAITYLRKAAELNPADLDVQLKLSQFDLAAGNVVDARTKATFVLQRRPGDLEAPLVLIGSISNAAEVEPAIAQLRNLPPPANQGAPVLTAIALIEGRRGHLHESETLLQQAIKASPGFPDAYGALAAIQIAQRNIPGATASFKKAAELSPPRSPRWLQYAQFLVRTGNPGEAKSVLAAVTTKAPDYAPGWTLQAEFALAEKDLPACETLIEKAIARDPYNLESLLLRSRLRLAQNRPADAVAIVEKILTSYPQLPVARFELARAQVANGDIGSAISNLYQVVNKMPGNTEAALLLAALNLRKGDAAASVILLRKLIEQRPDLIKAQMLLADAYRAQNNLDEALAIYRQVEGKYPENPETPLLRGLILSEQKKYPQAREAFERASVLAPEAPTPLEQLVNIDIAEAMPQEAHARITAAVEKQPKLTGPGQLLHAKVFIATDDFPAAEKALLKAIELMPDQQTAYVLLAGIYSRTEQVPQAIEKLEQAIVRSPKEASTIILLGFLQERQKNFAAARDAYQKVLQLDPKNFTALNNLAYLQAEKFNQLDDALVMAERAREQNPNEPNLADTLGWILFQKKQYTRALALLDEAADGLPNLPEVKFHQGMTHYILGEEQSARLALQQAVRPGAEYTGITEARSALEVLDIDPAKATGEDRARLEKRLKENKDDSIALLRLAAIDQRSGQTEQAIASLQAVLQINPKNVDALIGLARLFAVKKDQAKALEFAKAARKLAPDDGLVAQTLGRLAYQLGDYAWSASLLQESVRKQDPTPALQWDLALATYSVGNISDAEAALQAALASPPDTGISLFDHTGEARQMLDLIKLAADPAKAVTESARISEILKTQPDYVPALMVSGVAAERNGEVAQAKEAYGKALQHFPGFIPAKARLAVLIARGDQFDQRGYEFALQARTADPSNPEIARALGLLTFFKGDFSRANGLLNEALVAQPNDAMLLYRLGLSQLKSNLAEEGRGNLQRALDVGLDGDAAKDAKKLLADKDK